MNTKLLALFLSGVFFSSTSATKPMEWISAFSDGVRLNDQLSQTNTQSNVMMDYAQQDAALYLDGSEVAFLSISTSYLF
ncbi:hypothetical protein ACODG7_03870 [Vibrio anguillarum]|jgi:hypothetical protein|uniref:hypothetical protein n=1 Tax=Vibrio TaxID=662 RepID=UPI0002EAD283|nr:MULTISPECIES: hypothetical protein [Vibrio]MDQ2165372.1 hypothetical protein [Vibrio anguillarum]NNN47346.1 hypothetical protein [Vibrio sp. 2-2(8)]NNN96776.1 hypothetical protein [Vibrio sp. B4-6]OEE32128.1 hypothetical protein A1QW_11990 [Vibrio anguillarum]OEE41959.1 hypothetical protein A1QU_16125 [Vibrio anguillarum]